MNIYIKFPIIKNIIINILDLMRWLPDKLYLKLIYFLRTGHRLNLKNPQTYNEKLQWLKLYDRKPKYTMMVDKLEVRTYIADKIGTQYLIPLIGVWDTVDDINFETLPNQFVLKCTHDSGGIIICKNKEDLNIELVKKWLSKRLKRNFYYSKREWPYKNVRPRIIAEKFMIDESGSDIKDYKIFNFHGVPKYIEVDYDRFINHKRKIYTKKWEETELRIIYPNDGPAIPKPKSLEKMLELAKILSKDMIHLRTDFYLINNTIYFGELTFYHESGFGKFTPTKCEYIWGKHIRLN